MPICRKQDFIREITMMIRKESIIFEPKDRIAVKSKTGDVYMGSVYHDFDSDRLCLGLCNADGEFLVSKNGPLYLEDCCTSSQLRAVHETVSGYVEKSIYRARNLASINDMVSSSQAFVFEPGTGPVVSVDLKRNGHFSDMGVLQVFVAPSEASLYVVVAETSNPAVVNYPVSDLSDIAVSKVLESMSLVVSNKMSEQQETVRDKSSRRTTGGPSL